MTVHAYQREQIRDEVLRGLSAPRKHLPCRLLYDARGVKFDKLDAHLRCPDRYHRRAVQVLDRGERRFSAFTYVLTVSDDKHNKPSADYLKHLVDTAKTRGLPDDWIDSLSALG